MERTFISSVKELLHPIIVFPKRSLLLFWYAFLVWLFNTYLVIFLEKITISIEAWDLVMFRKWIYILIWLIIFHFLLKVLYKPRAFTFWRDICNYLDQIYLKKFIESDNNDIENIWTWRLISIIWTGVKTWTVLLEELLWDRVITLSIIFSSLWFIAKHSLIFFLATCLILVFAFFLDSYFLSKSIAQKKDM